MGILKYHQTSLISYERGWPLAYLESLIKPDQASHHAGCQVNIKCFYAKVPVLALIIETSAVWPAALVQKVIPGYLQRTVDNDSWAYLWLISHDLSNGVPLMHTEPPLQHVPLIWLSDSRRNGLDMHVRLSVPTYIRTLPAFTIQGVEQCNGKSHIYTFSY
jgi:hypothetical protein